MTVWGRERRGLECQGHWALRIGTHSIPMDCSGSDLEEAMPTTHVVGARRWGAPREWPGGQDGGWHGDRGGTAGLPPE